MNKAIYIKTNEGIEIFDTTLQAETRLSAMDYLEKRYRRGRKRAMKRTTKRKWKLSRKLLYKFACICGMI